LIYVHPDKIKSGNGFFNKLILEPNSTLVQFPNVESRDINYITGSSGCGKSTLIGEYANNFKKLFNSNDDDIILFRPTVGEDPALDFINPTQIELTDELYKDPITVEELENKHKPVLVIFDDCDTIQDKKINEAVLNLKNAILETGRKNDIYTSIVSHLMTDYKKSRIIMNELTSMTFFPCDVSHSQLNYTLKTYFGLDKNQIQKIIKLPSRWVTIYRKFPKFVLYESGMYMLNVDDEPLPISKLTKRSQMKEIKQIQINKSRPNKNEDTESESESESNSYTDSETESDSEYDEPIKISYQRRK